MAELSPNVRIVNPHPKGVAYMRRKKAERAIQNRFARWADHDHTSIRFINHACLQDHIASECQERSGYDRDRRMLNPAELRALPVVQPDRLYLLCTVRRTVRIAGRSGPARRVAALA